MALLTEVGLGMATQLDRALGYEANGGGTSWVDDPLGMVGQAQIASPLVTVTANRSAPRALATVKWDEEGVSPDEFTVVKDGVLVDFQTTREQAAWLAPYYQRSGRPVRSHGCAAVESAHVIPMQHMPNLSLEPHSASLRVEDLVADVPDGIFLERAWIEQMDAQGRTGLLYGDMREIRNGRLGRSLANGAILLDTKTLWRNITAVGGTTTQGVFNRSNTFHLNHTGSDQLQELISRWLMKGQPPQATGHTVSAAAATIANQPLINPERRG
jgi:TldD protein